jgi:hypothetical protein
LKLASLGLHVLPQLEINWQHQGVPIKAHLNFVRSWGAPVNAIRILEVKSTDKLSDTPHDSHLLQLHGKIGLLAQAWDKPAFSSLTLTPGRFSAASPPAPRSGAMPRLQLTLRPLTTTIFSTSPAVIWWSGSSAPKGLTNRSMYLAHGLRQNKLHQATGGPSQI